jgi:hypothetical protein
MLGRAFQVNLGWYLLLRELVGKQLLYKEKLRRLEGLKSPKDYVNRTGIAD